MESNRKIIKKRIALGFLIISLALTGLTVRLGWVQIVRGEDYQKYATDYQTQDVSIPAKRGGIFDRNGKELAISAVSYSVWVTPAMVKSKAEGEGGTDETLEKTADALSGVLELDSETVKNQIRENKKRFRIAKHISKKTADQLRKKEIAGIDFQEDVRRYYPLGPFACHVLGNVTDDNRGLVGIERKYNQELSGISGRWIKNVDVKGNSLSYGLEKYYKAEDGAGLVLTIDEVIQHYAEKAIASGLERTQARRVMCIVMETKTGEILAMAMNPEYDPNNPRVPLDPVQAEALESLDSAGKLAYWNNMWRNPMISDTYEPGSTFKLLTAAMALEEGLTRPDEHFVCRGTYNVSGTVLRCWRHYRPHGDQTLTEAIGNSCNPVFIQLAQRIGYDKYFEYLDLFGITGKTGIDFSGEGGAIIQDKKTAGPVGLATMSYGQGIAVTPIQLVTAVSAFGNDGRLMRPRLVKGLQDRDGKRLETFPPAEVRQVISKQTSQEILDAMEAYVLAGYSGAKIDGYRIGGKTGTANKAIKGGYSTDTDSSFIGIAPIDDPRITILVVVDSPRNGPQYGSATASPIAREILENTLRYMNVKPDYTQEEQGKRENRKVTVPDVSGSHFSEAAGALEKAGLQYVVSPPAGSRNFIVEDQYPKGGELADAGSMVYLYH